MAEARLTRDAFVAALHTKFGLCQDGTKPIELELVHVSDLQSTPRQEIYAILFRGPLDAPLPQRIYQLEHERMGTLSIFIVPVGMSAQGYEYEAVFNRVK